MRSTLRALLLLAALPAAFRSPAAAQTAPPRLLGPFDLEMRLTSSYDTNIDHDEAGLASYGLVPGLRLRYQDDPADPVWTVSYAAARHTYTNTERWDRVSHTARVAYAPEPSGGFHAETAAELSLRGSSEDRDLSNQYQVVQDLEYRFTRSHRLHLYGTLRWKRVPEDPDGHAFKPNTGLVFERRLAEGRRFQTDVRYEANFERLPEGDYRRWSFAAEYRFPQRLTGGEVEIEAKYRRKDYAARFVEIDDADVRRRDHQWVLGLAWRRPLLAGMRVEAAYAFETRDSNDPGKRFDAHLFGLGLVYGL
jgi:hypothetical protein